MILFLTVRTLDEVITSLAFYNGDNVLQEFDMASIGKNVKIIFHWEIGVWKMAGTITPPTIRVKSLLYVNVDLVLFSYFCRSHTVGRLNPRGPQFVSFMQIKTFSTYKNQTKLTSRSKENSLHNIIYVTL